MSSCCNREAMFSERKFIPESICCVSPSSNVRTVTYRKTPKLRVFPFSLSLHLGRSAVHYTAGTKFSENNTVIESYFHIHRVRFRCASSPFRNLKLSFTTRVVLCSSLYIHFVYFQVDDFLLHKFQKLVRVRRTNQRTDNQLDKEGYKVNAAKI